MDELELELEIEEEEDDKTANEPQSDHNADSIPLLKPIALDAALPLSMNIDITFVIDARASMEPTIKTIKGLTLSFYDKLQERMKKCYRSPGQLRVKVIAFRDYSFNAKQAMEESEFFCLPEEKEAFGDFVSGIEAKGGRDFPENALEAIILAMKAKWVEEGERKRHIIAFFTDAPVCPSAETYDAIPDNYPSAILKAYEDFWEAWNAIFRPNLTGPVLGFRMNRIASRIVMFAPTTYPWSRMEVELEQTLTLHVEPGKGGEELTDDLILDFLCRSTRGC